MTEWQQQFIDAHRVARLATVDAAGQPHVVPIVYAFDGVQLWTPLDAKPKRVPGMLLQRVQNIAANERVALVIDDYSDDWQQLAWVQIRGQAQLITAGAIYEVGVAALMAKYPQYQGNALHARPLIQILPMQIRSWQWS